MNIFPLRSFFYFIFFCSLSLPVSATDSTINLSQQELEWIKLNPTVTVANEMDWPPFDYVQNEQPAGYSIDVIRLIEKKTGLKMRFVNGYTWDELLQQFKFGEIDIMPAIYIDEERKKFTLFTHNYFSQPSVMVVHRDSKDIYNIDDLNGQRIAGIKGFSFTNILKNNVVNADIIAVDNAMEALKAVSLKEADVFIDSIGVITYLLENNYIPNLKIIRKFKNKIIENPALHIGVNKKNIILHSILNKALSSFSREEKQMMFNHWFNMTGSAKNANPLKNNIFTADQQAWLSAQPNIRIGVMNAWPPMDYVDNNGIPQGIGVEFIRAINKRLGGQIEIIPGTWKDIYKAIQKKELDAIMDITPRKNRKKLFNFTSPYIEVPHNIFTRKNEKEKNSLLDLAGMTVGVEKSFFIAKELRENHQMVRIKEYLTTSNVLDALSKGEVDAYVGNRAVANYIIENELITNIKIQGKIAETSSVNAIGVRKDWPILHEILQAALADITPSERSHIIDLSIPKNRLRIDGIIPELYQKLTTKERKWLTNHSNFRIGVDASWAPVEWIDKDGVYQGMTFDYMNLISKMLGLDIIKPKIMPWPQVLDSIKSKKLDVISAIVSTPNRQEYLGFTLPYLNFPFVIFTRNDESLITDIRDIYDKRVGIEKGYSSQDDLQRDHPQLDLVEYETTKEILHALSLGEIDAYVGNLTVAAYLVNQEGLTNIKVAAPTSYSFSLSVGVRKDWPELLSIIEKSFLLISEVQRNEIRQRWMKINYNVGVDYNLVIKAAIVVIIVLILFVAWAFFMQYQKRILSDAKKETDKANEAYLTTNKQLIEANIKLKEMDRMKSMFIASISHELRTPLNSIIGFSSMMERKSFGSLNDKYQDYVTRINRSGVHLLRLITDVIDISKIEAGRIDILLEEFEINEIVSETIKSLKQQIDHKNLTLQLDVAQNVILITDKRRLYQCLLNLLSNALKYTELGSICLSVEKKENTVLIQIEDTGIGINEKDQLRLFEAFERMESHLKVKAGGTGLGLYLTKKIVTELLQGNIGMKSALNEGSTFWIEIPMKIDSNLSAGV